MDPRFLDSILYQLWDLDSLPHRFKNIGVHEEGPQTNLIAIVIPSTEKNRIKISGTPPPFNIIKSTRKHMIRIDSESLGFIMGRHYIR